MPSPDCIWESLCQWWLRDDGTQYGWCLGTNTNSPEPQYTLFIYHSGGVLADERRLLHPSETICHPGCIDYRHWFRDARVGRWSDNEHLDLPLAGDDDLPRDALPGLHQTQ